MPGVKRKSVESGEANGIGSKKVKSESSKSSKAPADKKFAHKLEKKDKKDKKSKEEKKEKKSREEKAEKKAKKEKLKKQAEAEEEDELVESDTTEEENGFYGFSAKDDEAEANGEDSDVPMEDVEKPKKFAKGDKGKVSEAAPKLKGSADGANVTNSREAHQKQKQLAKERKAAKPNADEIQRAKKLWERLRIKSAVPKEERGALISELFDIVIGRVQEFVFRHDSVRPIQSAIKYGTMEQRRMIAEELKGSYKQLMEGKYSRHLIGKLLENGDEQVRDLIIPEFYGSVKRLINHPDASWMLDDIYRVKATKAQKAIMLREWYGPEFSVFKSADKSTPTGDLKQILDESPEKRKPILEFLQQLINQLIQKKLTGFTMLHDALLQYFKQLEVGSSEFNDCMRLIIGDKKEEEEDLLKNLAFTKSGAELVCLVLAYGSAKDRKLVLRSFKDAIELVARDQFGWQVLVTAYEVIDDTRETLTRVFGELVSHGKTEEKKALQQEKILGLSSELHGRISLLYPFVGKVKWLLPKTEQQDFIKSIEDIRQNTSKKDPAVRRNEIIAPLSESYISTVEENASVLAKDTYGCQFVSAILLTATGDKSAACDAIAALAGGDPTAEDHPSHSSAFARTLIKSLIAGGNFDSIQKKMVVTAPDLGFADKLYANIKGHEVAWATGDSSFTIVALMEAETFESKKELKKVLKKNKGVIEKAAKGSGEKGAKGNAGARILVKLLEE